MVQEELNRKEEEVANKVVALTTNATKMTVAALKNMLEKYIEEQKNKSPKIYKGKQSVKRLVRGGSKLTNIEITDQNIKSFSKTARKYSVDFALKKDSSSEIPKYFVFFKAKDVDVMTAAFKEFTHNQLNKSEKPTIREQLKKHMEKTMSADKERTRQKAKTREVEL